VNTILRRHHLTGAGLGTVAIASDVGDDVVTITYDIPGPTTSTTSRGCTLGTEPAAAGRLLTEAAAWSRYEASLELAGLVAGDHIYTVAATIDGTVVTGSTVFTVPAA
jgi:hypothetical protein